MRKTITNYSDVCVKPADHVPCIRQAGDKLRLLLAASGSLFVVACIANQSTSPKLFVSAPWTLEIP